MIVLVGMAIAAAVGAAMLGMTGGSAMALPSLPGYRVVASFVASGDVSDYTAATCHAITEAVAAAAAVPLSAVSVSVASASVRIDVTIDAADEPGASSVRPLASLPHQNYERG